MSNLPLAVTAGEPAGIGFDIILQCVSDLNDCIIIADQNELAKRAKLLGIDLSICHDKPSTAKQLRVKHIHVSAPVDCGILNASNSQYVLHCLDEALRGIEQQEYSAMVTAPLHKGIINDAGIPFIGHTEYLAQHTH